MTVARDRVSQARYSLLETLTEYWSTGRLARHYLRAWPVLSAESPVRVASTEFLMTLVRREAEPGDYRAEHAQARTDPHRPREALR